MPVGYVKKGKYYIYNHAQIIVKYHATASGDARVVGVFAEPFSVNHRARADGGLATCSVEIDHWFGGSPPNFRTL